MQPTKELIDEIFVGKLRRARAMSPEAKILTGPRLFEMGCEITKDGIRAQFPLADEKEVLRILQDRLALARRLRETS